MYHNQKINPIIILTFACVMNRKDAIELYRNASTQDLADMADILRDKLNPGNKVSWQIDRNVNYTNVCVAGCLFCNFHCSKHNGSKPYVLEFDDYKSKIDELKMLGGKQLLLQGGLHPLLDLEYFQKLFRSLKEYEPSLKLNALGPPEIAHIARISNTSIRTTLMLLHEAGLDTLPGAGAEILSSRVRNILSPKKPSVSEWVEVMKQAHIMGISTTATMVYGSIETLEERIDHLFTLKEIQSQKPSSSIGFRAFIPWPMQTQNTQLSQLYDLPVLDSLSIADEYIRTVAISRLILNNIQHIQASWLTVGIETALRALRAGADDLGSIMIEENVVASTGVRFKMDAQQMEQHIKSIGFTAWLRDQNYVPQPLPLGDRTSHSQDDQHDL